jgi:23S rRNA (adenine2503-C2)-methyltransferase
MAGPIVATRTDNSIWPEIAEINSSDENVKKFVFTKDNAVAESVLYKYPTYEDRTVICCSTQSGCPVGCRFCGAGDNFVRSLSADEIVSQPVHLLASQGIDAAHVDRMQIMFMSMGEPLLNIKHLFPALRELYALYPTAALLISTSGPRIDYEPLRRISVEIPTIGLQFSAHESTDEARNLLVPFRSKLTLEEMGAEGELWFEATGRQPFFNYCVHERNNTAEDVTRLTQLFRPGIWQATISVICERDESIAAANERQRQLASDFMQLMLIAGYSTRMFDPAGQDDIGGGCGQLWYVQDWMARHPDLARPSIGNGLPSVHTPIAEAVRA